jgi:hypothetical protein
MAFSCPSSGEPREIYNEVTRQILGGVIQKVKAAGKVLPLLDRALVAGQDGSRQTATMVGYCSALL